MVFLPNNSLIFVDVTTEHERHITAVAGSVVIFNCTLDVDCFTGGVLWERYEPSSNRREIWYNGQNINPEFQSSGASLANDTTHGWSALTISRIRLRDRGRFKCYVAGSGRKCQMSFQLTVAGEI